MRAFYTKAEEEMRPPSKFEKCGKYWCKTQVNQEENTLFVSPAFYTEYRHG